MHSSTPSNLASAHLHETATFKEVDNLHAGEPTGDFLVLILLDL